MTKTLLLTAVVSAGVLMGGCAQLTTQPVSGPLFSDTKFSGEATASAPASKRGEACMTSILGVATGDATIEAAKAAGGITTVSSVDHTGNGILGVYAKYCTIVKGQ